jgi:hypothetical protein
MFKFLHSNHHFIAAVKQPRGSRVQYKQDASHFAMWSSLTRIFVGNEKGLPISSEQIKKSTFTYSSLPAQSLCSPSFLVEETKGVGQFFKRRFSKS